MAESPDVNALKRRSRRRLVGAIALVLLAVIVLPMVFDQDPRSPAAPVGVRIPSEDDSGFTPKVTPRGDPGAKTPALAESAAPRAVEPPGAEKTGGSVAEKATENSAEKAAAKTPPEKTAEKTAEESAPERPAAKAQEPAASPPAQDERRRAEDALANASFVVVIGTYAEEKNARTLIAKLKSEKIPAYAEPLDTAKGPRTRVRAGPFQSEEAAEKARARIQRLGVQAGAIVQKAE